MKLISWNVNGLRAAISKGFLDFYNSINADIFSIQESKMQKDQITEEIANIKELQIWNSAEKKGYSGTVVFTKKQPLKIIKTIDIIKENKIFKNISEENLVVQDNEGRVIIIEYEKFFLINCYTPNSKKELERLDYRVKWEESLREILIELDKIKPIIYCGDLNVAHNEIDLKNPSSNRKNAGFTDQERNEMTKLLDLNFIDTFRYKYPDKVEYTWWSYMRKARENNSGWRIDYFVVSDRIKDNIKEAKIHTEILGSDHCPIELDIEFD